MARELAKADALVEVQQSPVVEGWPPHNRLAKLLCKAAAVWHTPDHDDDFCADCLTQAANLLDDAATVRAMVAALIDEALIESWS